MTTVLKLGGSVLTHKDERETVDETALKRAARAVGDAIESGRADRLVVVHGGGGFGHPAAAEHDISATDGTRDADSLVAVHRAMGRLNRRVVAGLAAADAPALPVRPLSVVRRTETGLDCPAEPVRTMLDEGFVPVVHGDVVVHEAVGGTVLSGDDLTVALAAALGADRVGVCSTVPGVLDDEGEVVPEVTSHEAIADVVGESDTTDVTGGMAGKLRALLAFDGPAAVFGPGDLEVFLRGGEPGTTVR